MDTRRKGVQRLAITVGPEHLRTAKAAIFAKARMADLILDAMVGLRLPVYHAHFDSAMTAEALYERIKFSQGQKIPLPTGRGVSRIFDDVTQAQVEQALDVWRERCA